MRRREFIGRFGIIGAVAASTSFSQRTSAQSAPKPPVIAWAGAPPPGMVSPQFIIDLTLGNFIKGLSEFGYEEGRNVNLVRRTRIYPDRVPTIDEMLALVKPDIIVAPATLEAVAAHRIDDTDCLCGSRGRGPSRLDCQRSSSWEERYRH